MGCWKRALIAGSALLLSACASVPLTSLPKLMSLDAETIDPANLELAVLHSDNVGITPGTAKLSIELTDERSGNTITTDQLIDTPVAALPPELRKRLKPGYDVTRFSVSDEAAAALIDFRARAVEMRERSGSKPKGTFSASTGFCSPDGSGVPIEPIEFTIFIRTKPEQNFFKLFKTQTMSFAGVEGAEEGFRPCPEVETDAVGPL